ncbi:MAG: cysteine desulfurase [Endomicrobium sp.]|nr:cysteine desulfurase [Endomicrobium sp.]
MKYKKVYLDNSATTIMHPEVIKEMQKYFYKIYGNPSSLHNFGKNAKIAIEKAREEVAVLLNANPSEIFFTGSGTESNNIAIFGIVNNVCGKQIHVITSKIEHHSVLNSIKHIEKCGHEVTYLDVDKHGIISVEDLKKNIKNNTLLVSIMHANNEVGSLQSIDKIAIEIKKINNKREQKIYLHSDSVQTAGKIPIDVKRIGVDLLSLSAHKFNGPKGVGVLYIKNGTHISPMFFGGHHEKGIRPGTENVPAIVGLAKAFKIANNNLQKDKIYISHLREKLKTGIINTISEVTINGDEKTTIYNILNVSFNHVEGEALLLMLDMKGIAVSTGSACASETISPSHVLSAMQIDPVVIHGTIRFSFGHYNTNKDIDYVLGVLHTIVEKLRSMSPTFNKKSRNI